MWGNSPCKATYRGLEHVLHYPALCLYTRIEFADAECLWYMRKRVRHAALLLLHKYSYLLGTMAEV